MDNTKEWKPDSDTVIIREQTKINQIDFKRCCQKIESLMSRKNAPNHSEAICSYLDELLSRNVGAQVCSALTLVEKEKKVFQNTTNRPKLASIIADNVKLYLDGKLAGTAKEIAFRCVNNWLAGIEAQEPTPTATDEQATAPQLPSELDTKQARKYFARAVEAGLMSKQYEWQKSQLLLSFFAQEMSIKLGLNKAQNKDGSSRISWKPFEILFGIEKGHLRQSMNDFKKDLQEPMELDIVTTIFQD